MVTGRGRTTVVGALSLVLGLALVACSSDGEAESLPSIAPMPVDVVSTTQLATTTTIAPVDPRLVEDCIEYVMFGAYTQNPLLSAMWEAADQNVGTLRDNCESLGLTDPAGLLALSEGLASLDATPTSTSTTTSTPSAPRATTTTAAPEPPVTEEPEPPATEPCPAGSHLNDAGECEPDPVDTSEPATTVTA